MLVAGGRGDRTGFYTIDLDTGAIKNLPDIPISQDSGQACGVVPSSSGGKEYVTAGGRTDEVRIPKNEKKHQLA